MTPERQAKIDHNHEKMAVLKTQINHLDDCIKASQQAYADSCTTRTRKLEELRILARENVHLLKEYVMPKGDPDED